MELAELLVHRAPKLALRVDAQLDHLHDAYTSLLQKSLSKLQLSSLKQKNVTTRIKCHLASYAV